MNAVKLLLVEELAHAMLLCKDNPPPAWSLGELQTRGGVDKKIIIKLQQTLFGWTSLSWATFQQECRSGRDAAKDAEVEKGKQFVLGSGKVIWVFPLASLDFTLQGCLKELSYTRAFGSFWPAPIQMCPGPHNIHRSENMARTC